MGKGTILRVLEGTDLSKSPQLAGALGKLLPGYVLETYQKVPDYKKSYARRVQSLYDAFLFILEAYPLDPTFTVYTAETLKKYVTKCKKACTAKDVTIEGLQTELEKFTAQVVQVISTNWKWPEGKSVKAATACLNDAECYQMMMDPDRPDIVTLTALPDGAGGKEYILQMDRGLASHYPELVKELEQLKAAKTPKTPSWFRKLPEYQQVFFCHLDSTIKPAELVVELDKFIKEWDGIKIKYTDWAKELGRIHNNTLPLPDWYSKLNPALKEMMKVLAAKPLVVDEQLKHLKQNLAFLSTNDEFKRTHTWVTKTPHWYLSICEMQQSFLGHVLKHSQSIETAMSYISSRLRTLPLPSNLRGHKLSRINAQGEVIPLFDERFGSSHIASRDVTDFPAGVQERHVSSNLDKVLGPPKAGVPCFLQTLISPLHAPLIDKLTPDLKLYQQALDAVVRSKREDIWTHNHPLNWARLLFYTGTKDAHSSEILAHAKKFVAKFPALAPLIADYDSTLNSKFGSATFADYVGRELFISSLEQLIILTIGGKSYGSCVSGKDRKAIELLHTDAMIVFHSLYKTWPKFNTPDKADRAKFVTIFASLYVSRHQQANAGLNAPGSEGIKTPSMYLPKDICEAIKLATGSKTFELDHDDRLATNNEVKNISKSLKANFSPETTVSATLMAIQLGEDTCTKLYDTLAKFINQKHCFVVSNTSWKPATLLGNALYKMSYQKEPHLPTGIQLILDVITNLNAGANNVERLEKIFAIILARLKESPTNSDRTKHTKSIYDCVANIFKAKSGNVLQTLAITAVGEWGKFYEASKVELSTKVAVKAQAPVATPAPAGCK